MLLVMQEWVVQAMQKGPLQLQGRLQRQQLLLPLVNKAASGAHRENSKNVTVNSKSPGEIGIDSRG
jgi:hypothetical protein